MVASFHNQSSHTEEPVFTHQQDEEHSCRCAFKKNRSKLRPFLLASSNNLVLSHEHIEQSQFLMRKVQAFPYRTVIIPEYRSACRLINRITCQVPEKWNLCFGSICGACTTTGSGIESNITNCRRTITGGRATITQYVSFVNFGKVSDRHFTEKTLKS